MNLLSITLNIIIAWCGSLTEKRSKLVRYLNYILLGGGAAIAVVALVFFLSDTTEPTAVEPQQAGETTSVTAVQKPADDAGQTNANADQAADNDAMAPDSQQPAAAMIAALTIDVARVKPDGEAVFAGRGEPNARISIFEGDVLLGETTADANGEWVVILDKPLAPGQHLVSVAMETTTGETALADVTLAIDIAETEEESPLVALLPQTETDVPKLLQSPDDVAPTESAKADAAPSDGSTTIDAVSVSSLAPRALVWMDGNVLAISGVSRGGIKVGAAIDGKAFAEALVLADGQWQLSGPIDASQPRITLDFSLYDNGGQQVATYQLPIKTRELSSGLDGSEMVIVQRGDALWRIAYRSYGKGVRYVDIVRRNAAAINDPDLIYPNQIFAIPK